MAEPTQPANAHKVREATYQKLLAYSKASRGITRNETLPVALRVVTCN